MPRRRAASNPPSRKCRGGRTHSPLGSLTKLVLFVATSCLLHQGPIIIPISLHRRAPVQQHVGVSAEPHSTIPRSNNRYTHYNSDTANSDGSGGGLDSLSAPHHPPWNLSPRIDTNGFLFEAYPRSPGEWEAPANIRGRHGPRGGARRRDALLSAPARVRQVPGDGNCLFHSIAACLYHAVNGTHLPMDSRTSIGCLRGRSLELRSAAVEVLRDARGGGRRRLFLQGEEWLEARELLSAAAAQFDLAGEEYCELMRRESYWGGGPEIVALCNHLQRPIHIYELIPAEEASQTPMSDQHSSLPYRHVKTSDQFALRRMACFGSPRFDRREPLHILSADSRFPDVEPRRIRRVGNHFLALFPVTASNEDEVGEKGSGKFRRHALIRGGSRQATKMESGRDSHHQNMGASSNEVGDQDRSIDSHGSNGKASEKAGKWDGGQGSWTNDVLDLVP